MLIYLAVLFFVIFAVYSSKRMGSSRSLSRLLLFSAFLSMVLIAGLRNESVGTDSRGYVWHFNEIQTLEDVVRFEAKTQEYGYWFLNWLIRLMSDEYMVLFLVVAVIVVGCYQYAILANSRNIVVSFFVFITMGFYTFFFNGARQGIACAICALAIKPLITRDIKKYIGYVLLAIMFHKTAIVVLPVYFLLNRKNTLKANILFGMLGVASALSVQKIVEISSQFDDRYQYYGVAEDGGGFFVVAYLSLQALLFMVFKKNIYIDRKRYNIFLNMLIFGAMVSLISIIFRLNPSGVLRLNLYFNISAVFLWPILFRNLRRRSVRYIIHVAFVVFYMTFFALTTERFSNLIPYTFNESLGLF